MTSIACEWRDTVGIDIRRWESCCELLVLLGKLVILFKGPLAGVVGARNYARSLFSQWSLSMTRT